MYDGIRQFCIKPVSWKGIQLDNCNTDKVVDFCAGMLLERIVSVGENYSRSKIRVKTGNNQLIDIQNGDWLIQNNKSGNFYTVTDAVLNEFFMMTDVCLTNNYNN